MKQTALLLFCLLIYLANFGQFSTVSSTYTEFDPGISFITTDGGSIAIEREADAVRGSNWNKYRTRVSLIRYDKIGYAQKIKELAEGKNVYSAFYSDLKKIGNKFWFVYIEPAESNDIGNIKAMEVDPNTLETGIAKTIASKESVNSSLQLFNGMSNLHIVSESSPNEKYTYFFIGTGRDNFFLTCLDGSLNSMWAKKITMKGVEDDKIKSIKIDDEGNIYLGFVKDKKPYVWMYSITGNGNEYSFDLGEATPKDIYLLVSQKTKSLVAGGAYFEGSKNCAGVYKTSISLEKHAWGELIKSPFAASLLEQFSKDGFASTKPKKFGLEPKFSGKLFELQDGSTGYVAEVRHVSIGERISSTHATSLLVVNFGPSSAFMARVPKYNLLGGIIYEDQYYASVCGSKLMLFYRDDPSNLNRDLSLDANITKAAKNTILVAATVERDGTVGRKQVGNGENVAAGVRQTLQGGCTGL